MQNENMDSWRIQAKAKLHANEFDNRWTEMIFNETKNLNKPKIFGRKRKVLY
jgi:hypothetical protein